MAIEDARLLALIGGTDEERLAALRALREPVAAEAVEPLLVAIERGGRDVAVRAANKLMRSSWRDLSLMTEEQERRLLAAAEKSGEPELFRALSHADPPRLVAEVLRAALARGIHGAPYLLDSIERAASDGHLGPAAVTPHFEQPLPDDARAALLRVAEAALRRATDPGLRRAVLRVLFLPGPTALRVQACWVLESTYGRPHGREAEAFALTPGEITGLFGAPRNALRALVEMLRDAELMREMAVEEWLQKLLKYRVGDGAVAMLADEPRALDELVGALLDTAENAERWALLRTACVEVLETLAPALDARGGAVDRLEAFLAKEPGFELEYWARRVARRLRGEPMD